MRYWDCVALSFGDRDLGLVFEGCWPGVVGTRGVLDERPLRGRLNRAIGSQGFTLV